MNQLYLVLLFLSDFGITVQGQGILFAQILAAFMFFIRIIKSKHVSRNFVLCTFILVISSIWSLYLNINRSFGSEIPALSIILSSVNVILFFVMVDVARVSIKFMTPRLLKLLIYLHLIYFIFEFLNFNGILNSSLVLDLFHINEKALTKNSMSMFGREHSYGSMGPLILMILSFIFHEMKLITTKKYFLYIAICIFIIISLTSKTALIAAIAFLLIANFRLNNFTSFKGLLILGFMILGLLPLSITMTPYLYDIFLLQGASSFLRFQFAIAGIYMIASYPMTGVGISGYKYHFIEAVEAWNIPIKFDIERILSNSFKGSVDPANYLIGIFSELGLILGSLLLWLLLRDYFKIPKKLNYIRNIILFVFLLCSFGFYYWGQPFVVIFLVLSIFIKINSKYL